MADLGNDVRRRAHPWILGACRGPACAAVAWLLVAPSAWPQWQVRGVKDIRTLRGFVAGAAPDGILPFGQGALFSGMSPRSGRELWRSDGTTTGTLLVQDLVAGNESAMPADFVGLGSLAVFTALERYNGGCRRLFVTDGTAAGTRHLGPHFSCYQTARPARIGNQIWFSTFDPVSGVEPWRTDGTEQGTRVVADLEPGAGFSIPDSFVDFRGLAAFAATTTAAGRELWLSDGTQAGTRLLDLTRGPAFSDPRDLVVAGSLLYFTADTGLGRELWCSDGTTTGTRLVRDIRPGLSGSQPTGLTAVGNLLFLSADDGVTGQELWVSDGTTAGTRLVLDSEPGPNGSWPEALTAFSGRLLYRASTVPTGVELWRSDGTAAGTAMVLDIDPRGSSNPAWLTDCNGTLLFAATQNYYDTELWRSDGTAAGTFRVKDILPGGLGSNPTGLALVGGSLWFGAEEQANDRELWQSDGTAAGTTRISDVQSLAVAYVSDLTSSAASDFACFVAEDDTHGRELWRSDGTAAGTFLLRDIDPYAVTQPAPGSLVPAGGLMYFVADDRVRGTELWVTDGSTAGTRLVRDIYPGGTDSWPDWFAALGQRVVFRANAPGVGRELWTSDGTTAGTTLVADLEPGAGDASPAFMTEMDGMVYFAAFTTALGWELWRTDGTATGTTLVSDLMPQPGMGSYPERLTRVGSRLFFTANSSTLGQELYVTDGTGAGTRLVMDIFPGPHSSLPEQLTAVGDRLCFLANDGVRTGLWTSDGTAAGTRLVLPLDASQGPYRAFQLTDFGGALLFAAADASGLELWRSDGTTAGTRRVKDIFPGPCSGLPEDGSLFIRWVPGTSVALLSASDGLTGLELWATDGTPAGTRLVWDLMPGAEGGLLPRPPRPALAGSHLLFEGDDGTGADLWTLDVMALAAAFGTGCPGTNGLRPVLGALGDPPTPGNARFALQVHQARPGSYAILPLALRPAFLGAGACSVLIDPAGVVLTLVAPIDAAGVGLCPLPIPFDPLLRGATLHGQVVVPDPQGALSGLAALSQGLRS